VKNRNETSRIRPYIAAGIAVPGLLGLLAAGGCSPAPSGETVDQHVLDQAARAIVRAEDRIAAPALADLIIHDRSSAEVIDLRPKADFDSAHIEGARHAELTSLLSADGRSGLAGMAMPVLVSDDGSQAAQAAALLRIAGIKARALDGGYAAWRRLMEGEDAGIPVDAAAARAEAKRHAVACWFEGDYVAAAGLTVKQDAAVPPTGGYVPPLEPAAPAADDPLGLGLGLGIPGTGQTPDQPARKLKIREGC
jgi:rhodanese-related sulfurtransferase